MVYIEWNMMRRENGTHYIHDANHALSKLYNTILDILAFNILVSHTYMSNIVDTQTAFCKITHHTIYQRIECSLHHVRICIICICAVLCL